MFNKNLMLPFLNPMKIFYVEGIFDDKIKNPWSLEIQPTNKCNLKCSFCAYKKRRKKDSTQLHPKVFNDLINSIKKMGIKGVYISGGGEPLLWSSKKKKISDYINKLSKISDVAVITNGIHLTKDNFDALKNIFYVLFSLFDINFENAKKITKITKKDFSVVLNNIESLVKYKKKIRTRYPFLSIKTVVTPQNYENVISVYNHIKKLNADYHIFRLAIDFECFMEPYLTETQYNKLKKQVKLNKKLIDKKYTNLNELFSCNKFSKNTECCIVKKGLYCCIDAKGDVYPCLYYVGNPNYCVGNIYNRKLQDIWKSKRHREVITKLNNLSKKGRCYELCRFKRYNFLIENKHKIDISPKGGYKEMHASFI